MIIELCDRKTKEETIQKVDNESSMRRIAIWNTDKRNIEMFIYIV